MITVGSAADCAALPAGGTEARFLLINHKDLADAAPFTFDADGNITAVTLKAGGKVAYEFTGFRNDMKKFDEVVNPGVGLNEFHHGCGMIVYKRTQLQKNMLEQLSRGKFVVVAENRGRDTDALEVLGVRCGVEIVVGKIRDAHANGGYFVVNFKTIDGDFEPKLPQTLGATYALGCTIRDGLLVPTA